MNLEPPAGLRDFTPEIKILRKKIFNRIEKIFIRYGFDPIETSTVEYWDILKGKYGEEAENKLIWRFRLPYSDKEYSLRYDHTIPLARFYSRFQFPLPFKRYVIDKSYRYDNPQKGRYREFYQADFDIIGSREYTSDAEIINLVIEVFKEFKFNNYKIIINNREFLRYIFEKLLSINQDKIFKVYNIIDKLDKIGIENVEKELNSILDTDTSNKIINIIQLKDQELIDYLSKFNDLNELINYNNNIFDLLVDKKNVELSLSLVRGLDYYTGMIFEARVDEPKIGSLAGGGRYDNLIGKFSNRDIPAVGGSIGIERLIDAGIELKIFKMKKKTYTDLVVVYFNNTLKDAWSICNKLRSIGINCYIDIMSRDFNKQIKYAVDKDIRYLLIVGEKEIKNGFVLLQDRETKERINIKIEELDNIKNIIYK
ncbi:histidine--tRNA ligase [Nanobdella aerobiophila]|uniref:Histidine--tRNA ligase n=1 Tax=Nanobdella aerobiophila TaxID=2586965 RepID=A0A915SKV4_9ARCH|nr:histidine--tRNA ligase [Nanobdella aerobiophila]BBL45893.1 histidine--tRNA ligase [Nanobdella aerobiophila]